MATTLGKLSPAEFEIMEALWSASGESAISDVLLRVNAAREGEPLKRATIQVQLRRLEEKGWLTHREDGHRFFYTPSAGREAASATLAGDLTERVFDGSCAELVRCLFDHQEVTQDEIARIRALLDKAESKPKA